MLNVQRVETPLYLAVMSRHSEVSDALIEAGADINIAGPHGLTPLMVACQSGDDVMVKLLLHHKPNLLLKEAKGIHIHELLAIFCNPSQITCVLASS